jgi:hypothetical protein
MNKIGTSAAGTVIVEMSSEEFEALMRIKGGGSPSTVQAKANPAESPPMSHAQRAAFIAERLKKLRPKKRDSLVHSVEAMFQFTGGIEAKEIEKVISTLVKQKIMSITPDGKVTFA